MQKTKENIIVFGTGWYYRSKENEIKDNYSIIAFLDNAIPDVCNDKNIPIYNPAVISKLPKVRIIIMSNQYFIEMYKQLNCLKVEDERIVFGISLFPCIDESEKLLASVEGRIEVDNGLLFLRYKNNKQVFSTIDEYKKTIRGFEGDNQIVNIINKASINPLSRRFGLEYGKSIARYYIDQFINTYSSYIRGTVVEIGDDRYTQVYGGEIEDSYIMHVENRGSKNVIKGNLETGEIDFPQESIDCFICTQTIQMIYGVREAVGNIYQLLKPNGVALITVSGISQLSIPDYTNWGEYWRFTDISLKRLLLEQFDDEDIEIITYGNVKMATALLYGICVEEMTTETINYHDEQYQVIIGAAVKKHMV